LPLKESPREVPVSLATSKRGWQGMFDALSIRNFRLYWLGLVTLTFASQLQLPAQSWLAYELTHSPLKLTLVAAMQAVPMIVFSVYSGVFIDRIQKRSILLIAQSFATAIAIIIAVLIGTGHIQYWHLLVASFLGGVSASFNMTARYAIVAELVPVQKLYNATALNNAGSNAVATAGPAISGILIGVIRVQGAYYVGIVFYIIGIIIISLLPATSKLGQVSKGSVLKNYAEGIKYLRLQKAIVIILIMEMALTFFGTSYQGLMPVFANLLSQQSAGYGFMLAAVGIGSMLGSLIVASLGNFKRKGLILLTTGIILGIFLGLFANMADLGDIMKLGQNNFYLALVLLMGIGFFVTSYTTTSNTIVQMNTSDEFRGRMTSFYSMVIGFYPLTTFMIGAIAEVLGAPMALTIGATCLTLFMIIMAIASRRIRLLG
jgi:MFS family permease